jgi:hypothetical protein
VAAGTPEGDEMDAEEPFAVETEHGPEHEYLAGDIRFKFPDLLGHVTREPEWWVVTRAV